MDKKNIENLLLYDDSDEDSLPSVEDTDNKEKESTTKENIEIKNEKKPEKKVINEENDDDFIEDDFEYIEEESDSDKSN
jgi:hypothetical protein